MKENTIEEMFARYQPDMGDNDKYMEALSKKLEAVEYVKKYNEEQARRHRKMLLVVFAGGVITGAIGIVLALLHPFWTLPPINIPTPVTQSPIHLPNLAFLLCLCLTGLGITGLVAQRMALQEK
ncbi:MAG: hypothetical protein J5741_08560 [Bacteroidales bacterium]|nr:hypothetical protein [Bacteroidales bacterium]